MQAGNEGIGAAIQRQSQCHPPATPNLILLGGLVPSVARRKFLCGRAEHPCPILALLPDESRLWLEDRCQDTSAREQLHNLSFHENWRAP